MDKIPSMVDAMPQLLAALRAIEGATVDRRWPRSQLDGDTVIITEITNNNTANSVVDSLAFQLDVWCADPDRTDEISVQADAIMTGIGFRRMASPPVSVDDFGYRATKRYSRRVDKRYMRLVD